MNDVTLPPLNRVLLVDDDEVTNLMHARVIKRSGLVTQVEVVNDGLQALEVLTADIAEGRPLPELVFLDINMPRMGGFEFLEEYAKLQIDPDAQLIIVMLSTSLLRADHERAEQDPNVHSFCEKPLQVERLAALIEDIRARQASEGAAA